MHKRITRVLALVLVLGACGGPNEGSETGERDDTSGGEGNAVGTDPEASSGQAPSETCSLRDGAVDLALPMPAGMHLVANDDGCFVLEGDVPGTSPAVVVISAIPVATHSINSDRLAAEPDGARQYFRSGSMLGAEASIEDRGEEAIVLLMQNTTSYRLFAPEPRGADGPRDVTVARVITDEQMIISVMAVSHPDDEERRARLMSIVTGMVIAP